MGPSSAGSPRKKGDVTVWMASLIRPDGIGPTQPKASGHAGGRRFGARHGKRGGTAVSSVLGATASSSQVMEVNLQDEESNGE